MAWMLQPHNYWRAMSRNLYNVGYRASGMYKGMGQGQCPGDPGCPGYVAPGSMDYQTSLLQAILENQTGAQQVPTAPSTVNYTPWIILGGGLLLVMMMARGR